MTILRDKDTKSVTFRHIISEVAALLTFETTRDLPVEEVKVTTPLCETTGCRIKGSVTVVLSCVQAWALWRRTQCYSRSQCWSYRMSRNEETLLPMEYYCKMPADMDAYTIVVDPMLATGGSAIAAIDQLKKRGMKNLRFMCLVAAPEGVEKLNAAHPDVLSTLLCLMIILMSMATSCRAWAMQATEFLVRYKKLWNAKQDPAGMITLWRLPE